MAIVKILIGCQGSGKDTILNEVITLGNKQGHPHTPIISTTSRPMRNGEVDGVQYNFVNQKQAKEMLDNDDFIEHRSYLVANGDTWVYGITKDSIDINSNNEYIVIVDFKGCKELCKYLSEKNIEYITYYIEVGYQSLLLRSLHREGKMTNEQVFEVVRRFNDDLKNVAVAKYNVDVILPNNTKEDIRKNAERIVYGCY